MIPIQFNSTRSCPVLRTPLRALASLLAAAALSVSVAAAQGNTSHHGQNSMGHHPMTNGAGANHTGMIGRNGTMGQNGTSPRSGESRTVSGRVAGLDLKTRTFNLVQGGQTTAVDARHATIRFRGKLANLNRLLGSPSVRVQGSVRPRTHLLEATNVDILTPPNARLQRSGYTRHARPPIHKLEPNTRRG